jgi:hypothetical protein
MRTFAALTVAGVGGMVLLKLLATVVFPLLGVLVGLLFMTVKLALMAAVIYFVYTIIRKKMDEHGEDQEVELEVEQEA